MVVTKFLIWRPIWDIHQIKANNKYFHLVFYFTLFLLWGWDIHQIKANNKYFHMVVTKFLIWRPIGRFFILHAMGMRHTSN